MRARAETRRIDTITLAHQIEAMAREKRLKALGKYLARRDHASGSDNVSVIAMFEQLAAKGGAVKIRRVTRSPD